MPAIGIESLDRLLHERSYIMHLVVTTVDQTTEFQATGDLYHVNAFSRFPVVHNYYSDVRHVPILAPSTGSEFCRVV